MRRLTATVIAAALVAALPVAAAPARAEELRAVAGSGSTWSANMVEQWTADIKQYGISVSFSAVGSSAGRRDFTAGTSDFAVSEIPYGLTDATGGLDRPPTRGFAYLPIVAGGTAFMYNLTVAGKRVTNLRLSGENVSKIFTGQISTWDDPALKKDNPQIALPARRIVPVVRSDGSGTTAQFTTWMSKEHPDVWNAFCTKQRISYTGSCPFTSNFPSVNGFVSQSGSLGVSGFVASPTAEGAITFVEYSYALRAKFPVVKVLNASGNYIEPTAKAVAVGLLRADIQDDRPEDRNTYLTQILDGVYRNPDKRSYPLSSYSYMIIPTSEGGTFKTAKGRALSRFLYYSVCEGQQAAEILGYSPLPQNLVKLGLDQIRLIPGVDAGSISLSNCSNPTFSKTGVNTLAQTAPQPPACDRVGAVQCTTATGGARTQTQSGGSGGSGSTGGSGAATGSSTGSTTGSGTSGTASTGTAGATGSGTGGLAANPLLPGTATSGGTTGAVDPETGLAPQVADDGSADLGGTSGTQVISGVAVAAPSDTGTPVQGWFMGLAALSLLAGTVGPPLLRRRMATGEGL
jgi:phosphate ABC transporter phosphate-binding protein